MSDTSSILSLPFIQPSQAQKHVTHNEALRLLDVAVQAAVSNRDQSAPPPAPLSGDRHIVAPGGSGDWAGHDGEIALFDGTGWQFFAALPGWQVQVVSEDRAVVFDGTTWAVQAPDLDNLDGVGIGTTADATNRLAVAADATLLTHAGDGHQLKINKSQDTDTASLLFQTGWSGRAEMGTAGSDGFAIKVSANGSTWFNGLEIDSGSGQVAFPSGAEITGSLTGNAVQQSATDVTAGRLMRADYGYGPGNVTGIVTQSGGVPTGAVFERGSNANGDYVRFADGTQICWQKIDDTAGAWTTVSGSFYVRSAYLTWTLPATFSSDAISASASPQYPDGVTVMGCRIRTFPETTNIKLLPWSSAALASGGAKYLYAVAFGRWFD